MAGETPLDLIRKSNPEYAGMSDSELTTEFTKQFPSEATRFTSMVNVYEKSQPQEGTDWKRMAEIGGKRFGEGMAATVGSPAVLAGLLTKFVESGGEETSLGQDYIRAIANDLMQLGQIPVDLWRRAVGAAPAPETLGQRVTGNVAEVAGGAAVPLVGAQGVVVGVGRGALQAGGRAALSAAVRTGTAAQTTLLQRLASMTPAQLAKVEATLAIGGGVGRTGAEEGAKAVGPEGSAPIAGFIGELVGAFGLNGARNLVTGAKQLGASHFTKKGAQTRVGRELAETIPPGSQFEKNLAESVSTSQQYGTKPTLATATQSPGAASLQAQVTRRQPGMAEVVRERGAASETAIQRAGEAIPGQGPGDLEAARGAAATSLAADRQAIEQTANELRGQLNGYVANASNAVQGEIAAAGTIPGRDISGEAIVGALKRHEAQARMAAGKLFDRVDPENAVKLPTQDLREAVNQVVTEGSESLRSDIVPGVVRRLNERLGEGGNARLAEMAKQLDMAPNDPRLPAMAKSAGMEVAAEVPFNQLRRWRSDLLGELRDQASAVSPNREAMRNTSRVLDSVESTLDQTAALGSDAAERYKTAAAAYRDYAERFRQGVVADVLRRGPRGEEIRKNVEDIAGSFFKGRAGGPISSAQDFVAAVGDDALARRGLRDYALGDFLKSAYDGGVLNTKRAQAWFKGHAESLAQFPEIETELRGIMRQGKNLDDVQQFVKGADSVIERSRTTSLDQLDRSAASAFIGADSDRAVAAIMTGNKRQQGMAELVGRMGNDEAALRGLRRAVWDHLSAGDFDPSMNRPLIDPGTLRQTIEQNRGVLRTLYTPDQLGELDRVARAAELAVNPHKVSGVGGASTPGTDLDVRQIYTVQQLFSRAWAAARWASSQFVVADAFARRVTNVFDQLSVAQLRGIYNQAVYDPRVAKKLLEMGRADFNEKQMATTLKGFLPGAMERVSR